MAKWCTANLYVGTSYTIQSACEASISCANKQNTACKFFPSGGKATIVVLGTNDKCNNTIELKYELYKFANNAWSYIGYFYSPKFKGWGVTGININPDSEPCTYELRATAHSHDCTDGVYVNKKKQLFIVGNVASENLPLKYWTKEESEHVKGMLADLYSE